MIKILDEKSYISMDEYYVIHSYQVKPTIKYTLYVTCTQFYMLCILYLIHI
jgi:hypothetical protein